MIVDSELDPGNLAFIGADTENGSPDGYWSGNIDEVRLFSTARTSEEIWSDRAAHNLAGTNGLAKEWLFDEGMLSEKSLKSARKRGCPIGGYP